MQKSGRLPIVQHPAHGGDGGTPQRPCVPTPAGAPVGAVSTQTATLLHAARRDSDQHDLGLIGIA